MADNFLSFSSYRSDVVTHLGPHGLSGMARSEGMSAMQLFQWQVKSCWSVATDDPVAVAPLLEECSQCVNCWRQ